MRHIYLDNASTTPVDPRVRDAMIPLLTENFGNPSSVHYFGRRAKVLLEDTRDKIAEFLGVKSSEIFFTSGGTESNNHAIKGIALSQLGRKNHIISSPVEHSSVIDTLNYLKDKFSFNITWLSVNKYGEIDLNELEDKITEQTFLVCIMYSNNELGTINDINSVAGIISDKGIYLHTDMVQSLGKCRFRLNDIGCSTASFSAHKIYGPKGAGLLYIRKNTQIEKYLHGGKQERNLRGGTENLPAIAGFGKAVEILKDEMVSDIELYTKLNHKIRKLLTSSFGDDIIINSPDGNALHNILNISINPAKIKIDADALLIKLDTAGIAVSSGSACASGSIQPSHVLKAIGYDDDLARSSLRISFGRFNTEEEVEVFVRELKGIIYQ